MALDVPNLLGAVSLIFWGLVLIVLLKYVPLSLRADNQGEGGIAWSVYPLVVLSTIATVIASQATISGTFSMTHEAISLGTPPH